MSTSQVKLLIIEDDIAFANTLKRRLQKNNFNCFHAENTNDALLLCHREVPEHILLDMKLGQESGLNLIKPLRQICPQSKIILLTGFASIATAVDAIKLGADDYLAKPIDSKTLLSALLPAASSKRIKPSQPTLKTAETTPLSTEQVEWEHIQQVLKFNQGNVSATARQLSMHRRTLQRKLQKRSPNNKND